MGEVRVGRRQVLVALAAAAGAGLAACTDGTGTSADAASAGPTPAAPSGASTPSPSAGRPSAPSSSEPVPPGPSADADPRGEETLVATSVVDELRVHERPADLDDPDDPVGAAPRLVLDRRQEVSGQVVLLAREVGAAWAEVQLPVRPNGSVGWVRVREVALTSHRFAVEVRLGAHTISVTRAGREVLASAIGVGTQDTPTPGGDYYVKELLAPPDPTGVYGPYAYGLSGFSTVLTEFAGGEGVIGIHGTNRPELVGTDVSSGCIRLPNDVITALVEDVGLPLGTPVTIAP